MNPVYTPEHDAIIRSMWTDGATHEAIARRLGWPTTISVRKRRARLGLARPNNHPKWTPEQDAILIRMRGEGVSFSAIAMELNCGYSRNACIGRAKRLGLKSREAYPRRTSPRIKPLRPQLRNKWFPTQPRPPKPAPIPKLVTPPEFLGVSLFDLKPNQCRFPKGEGMNILFCGQPTANETSWCAYCSKVVFTPRKVLTDEGRKRLQRSAFNSGRIAAMRRVTLEAAE